MILATILTFAVLLYILGNIQDKEPEEPVRYTTIEQGLKEINNVR